MARRKKGPYDTTWTHGHSRRTAEARMSAGKRKPLVRAVTSGWIEVGRVHGL